MVDFWLQSGDRIVRVTHEDTYKRCLGDGWQVIPDPRPAPLPTTPLEPEPSTPPEAAAPAKTKAGSK